MPRRGAKAKVMLFGARPPVKEPKTFARAVHEAPSEITPVEVAFASRIAHTDKKRRQKGIAVLCQWLRENKSLSTTEFLRLWKASFYAMWLCDKHHAQLKLAVRLATLSRLVDPLKYSMFVGAFYTVIGEQWKSLDRYRVDKFFLLLRIFQSESFDRLRRAGWDTEMCRELVAIWTAPGGPMSIIGDRAEAGTAVESRGSMGITIHFIQCFITELLRVADSAPIDETSTLQIPPPTDISTEDFVGGWSNPHIDEEEIAVIRQRANDPTFGRLRKGPKNKPTLKGTTDMTSSSGSTTQNSSLVLHHSVAEIFLEPFLRYSTSGCHLPILKVIHNSVFRKMSDKIMRLEDFTQRLFSLAANRELSQKNRNLFFDTFDEIDQTLAKMDRKADYISCLKSPESPVDVPVVSSPCSAESAAPSGDVSNESGDDDDPPLLEVDAYKFAGAQFVHAGISPSAKGLKRQKQNTGSRKRKNLGGLAGVSTLASPESKDHTRQQKRICCEQENDACLEESRSATEESTSDPPRKKTVRFSQQRKVISFETKKRVKRKNSPDVIVAAAPPSKSALKKRPPV